MKLPLWRRHQDSELDEEIRAHLAMAIADRVDRGEDRDAAERAVRREFGNVALVKEVTRDTWGWVGLDELSQDVHYACRTLRKSPGFTLVAVLTLALGIGANTAMFSVINAVLLRPLPFPTPERLVAISGVDLRPGRGATSLSASWPDFFDFRARARTLEHVTAYRATGVTMTSGGRSRYVPAAVSSADLFATLGVQPALGRVFRTDEERAGADVAVISDALWRSEFGADPAVLGRTVTLNSRAFVVVGVAPAAFHFPIGVPAADIWITCAEDARVDSPGDTPMTQERGAHFLQIIGRLVPAASLSSSQRELEAIAESLGREYPDESANRSVRVAPQLDALVGDTSKSLLVLLAAVGCVLLIACVNLANLLLARGAGRGREIELRSALGASRLRIVRQLLTESAVLAAMGSAIGLAVAYGSIALLVHLAPVTVRGLDEVRIDGPVLAFTVLIAAASALVFGLMPALQAAGRASAASTATRSTQAPAQRRLRNVLVVAETAISVMLLVAAGLLLRSFDRLLRTRPGFDPEHVVTASFRLPDSRYPYARQIAFYEAFFSDLAGVPGIEAAGGARPLPLSGTRYTISFQLPGGSTAPGDRLSAAFGMVSPGYFRLLRIPIVGGRDFTAADNDAARRVVIVNQAFARQYFPNVNPIGQRMKPGVQTTEKETPWREVVGVVGDVRQQALSEAAAPAYFIPYPQGLISPLAIVVRSNDPTGAAENIRHTLARHDPELSLYDVKTMDEYLASSVATPRFQTLLLAVFAGVGLALTAIGLYGVMAYGVAQRTREFGIRLALGARPGEMLALVMRGGLGLVGAGLVAGVVGGAFATRLLAGALYGVDPLDPTTFVGVAALLIAVAMFASYVPARRATRVDPMLALRTE